MSEEYKYNPWGIPKLFAVTASPVRKVALQEYEIAHDIDGSLYSVSGKAEQSVQNGEDHLIIDYLVGQIPYCVQMAQVKNSAIREAIVITRESLEQPIATIDSTIVVNFGEKMKALNKHRNDERRINMLLTFYDKSRGSVVYSDSGVVVSTPNEILRYHLKLFLGIINPDLNLESLEKTIRQFSDYSGGITVKSALNKKIIVPHRDRPFPQLNVERIGAENNFITGSIFPHLGIANLKNHTDLFYHAASGILPKDLNLIS